MKKIAKWVWPFLVGISLALLVRFFVVGSVIPEDQLLGKTRDEVRQAYGEPGWEVMGGENPANSDWVYYHGMIGRATAVDFENDVVVKVNYRMSR